jgi:hypothetical protein
MRKQLINLFKYMDRLNRNLNAYRIGFYRNRIEIQAEKSEIKSYKDFTLIKKWETENIIFSEYQLEETQIFLTITEDKDHEI